MIKLKLLYQLWMLSSDLFGSISGSKEFKP